MVDEEVENILAEIREGVRARPLPASAMSTAPAENGAEPVVSPLASRDAVETSASEALARLDSYFAVTARAWDRLPPIVSNRSGSAARMELWVKRQIKSASRWFTWEQINFNAAVHHALRDSLEALSSHEQALEKVGAELEALRRAAEQSQAMSLKLRDDILAQRKDFQAQRETFQAQLEAFQAQLSEIEVLRETERAVYVVTQSKELDTRLLTLARQMQERLEQLQEEHRVCFKQLSLEATEAAVLEDRARRKAEASTEELRRRLDQIENSKK